MNWLCLFINSFIYSFNILTNPNPQGVLVKTLVTNLPFSDFRETCFGAADDDDGDSCDNVVV